MHELSTERSKRIRSSENVIIIFCLFLTIFFRGTCQIGVESVESSRGSQRSIEAYSGVSFEFEDEGEGTWPLAKKSRGRIDILTTKVALKLQLSIRAK